MKDRIFTIIWILLLSSAGSVASAAELDEPSGPGVAIDLYDPSGVAMSAFHAALREAENGSGQAKALFYGASHVASDTYTGRLRRLFQARFGDAGHGFVLPAKPWRYYRHRDVVIDGTLTWWGDWVGKTEGRSDGWYGLAGVSISSSSPNDYASVATTKDNPQGQRVSRFDVYYLKQPGGGSFDLWLDGKRIRRVSTAELAAGAAYETITVRDGGHQLKLVPVGDGEVRLFGVAMDRDVAGFRLDALGVNGARAVSHLEWDDTIYAEQLARRNPDLLVIAYGTNESGDTDQPIEEYEEGFRTMVQRARTAAPQASCLFVGPSDRPVKEGRRYVDRPRTAEIVDVQKKVAAETGCAMFDMVAFMGGPLSMKKWVKHDPPFASKDHVHFTSRGYDRMADVLFNALLKGYSADGEPRD